MGATLFGTNTAKGRRAHGRSCTRDRLPAVHMREFRILLPFLETPWPDPACLP